MAGTRGSSPFKLAEVALTTRSYGSSPMSVQDVTAHRFRHCELVGPGGRARISMVKLRSA